MTDPETVEALLSKYAQAAVVADREYTKSACDAEEMAAEKVLAPYRELAAEVERLRANVSSGRLTHDISKALRKLAGDIGSDADELIEEAADQLDELVTLLAKAETARDRYKTLFDEKVVDRRRLVGLMRTDGQRIRELEAQRDQVLALCDKTDERYINRHLRIEDIRAVYSQPSDTEESTR